MQIARKSDKRLSHFWLAPDFKMGLHHFIWGARDMKRLPHTHGEYEIHVCLSGPMEFFRDGELQIMEAGDVLVIHPDQLHWGQFGENGPIAEGVTFILNKST